MIGHITVGSDPEIWIKSKITNNPIPTIGIILGEKDEPLELLEGGYKYLRDNCSLEFNIPPAKTQREFVEFHEIALAQLTAIVDKLGYALLIQPSVEFHWDLLKSEEATTIGCSEDFNVYTENVDKIPDLGVTNTRYSGGHIHIGWENPNWLQAMQVVKYMDLFLGLPAVILDEDRERKQHYGNAGRCRVKEYGVEYRTLSNFWLKNEDLLNFVYQQVQKAIAAYNQFGDTINNFAEQVKDIIDSNNASAAEFFIQEYNVIEIESLKRLKDGIPGNSKYVYSK